MGKKKKKQKRIYEKEVLSERDQKKALDKKFNKALKEIEDAQLFLFEADKEANRRRRKAINKRESYYLNEMSDIKARRKLSKKWKKTGFLDTLMELLEMVIPIVKLLAKMVCALINSFLSVEGIKENISIKTLNKISKVFDIAMAI